MSNDICQALKTVQERIIKAALNAGRLPAEVILIAVSKTFPASDIKMAYQAGCRQFGENYVQELESKTNELDMPNLIWHFIGPLQSNKTKVVAERAQWVHSVDRLKIAKRLSDQRPVDKDPLNICIQVNVSQEDSKSGCSIDELPDLAHLVDKLPNLKLRGLMCIPDPHAEEKELRKQFAILSHYLKLLKQQDLDLDVLSMGMSADIELAIAEGATHVRVGSAIFGARHYTGSLIQK